MKSRLALTGFVLIAVVLDGIELRLAEPEKACKGDFFKCEDNRCIPMSCRCDGDIDCQKEEDEKNCPKVCGEREFKCGEVKSARSSLERFKGIPEAWKCDGEFDCEDKSDDFQYKNVKCNKDVKGYFFCILEWMGEEGEGTDEDIYLFIAGMASGVGAFLVIAVVKACQIWWRVWLRMFGKWWTTLPHRFVYALVGAFMVSSVARLYTFYQSYGSEMNIFKGFTEELNSHEDLTRFHKTIMLCHTSTRFTPSFFFPVHIQNTINVSRLVRDKFVAIDHIGILSESFEEKNQSTLDSCDYVIDIDESSLTADSTSRETSSAQWKPVLSLPYLNVNRTDTFLSFFSIPFFSPFFDLTHYTTITLYRRVF